MNFHTRILLFESLPLLIKTQAIICLCTCIYNSQAQCLQPNNYIVNSGFETIVPPCGNIPPSPPYIDAAFNQGCIPGWFAAWGTPSVCNNGPYQGTNYACLGANNESIFTNLILCEENEYNLRFFAKKISGSSGNLQVYLANGLTNLNPGNSGFPPLNIEPDWVLLQSVPLSTNGLWVETNVILSVPANPINTQLLFVLSGSLDIGIDEVTIERCDLDLLDEIFCSNLGSGNFQFEFSLNSQGQSANIESYCWTFGDGNNSDLESGNHTYSTEGVYEVCISIFSDDCCVSTLCREIVYEACSCNCESNEELPVVLNPPDPVLTIFCSGPIPDPPILNVTLQCGNPEITFEELSGGTPCFLTFERTWTINNPCGIGITLNQTVELVDTTAPVFIALPLDLSASCEDYLSLFTEWVDNNGFGIASDNCGVLNWSASYENDPSYACEIVSVTFSITDSCENSRSHIASFSVIDDIPPEIMNPPLSELTISCISELPAPFTPNIEDNCDNQPTYSYFENQIGNPCDLFINRSWILEDVCLNLSFFEQTIRVIDTEAPLIVIDPVDLIINCDENFVQIFSEWLSNNGGAQAQDNCSGVTWVFSYSGQPGDNCTPLEVEFTAIDECGNFTTAAAFFILEDDEAPAFLSLPQDITIYCAENPGSQIINWIDQHAGAIGSDPCSELIWENDFDGDTTKTTYQITYTVSDQCGNNQSASASILIVQEPDTSRITIPTCDLSIIGTDTIVFTGANCDSIVLRTYIPAIIDTGYLQIFVCDSMEVRQDTLIYILPDGCDSVQILSFELFIVDTIFYENQSCLITEFGIDTLIFQGQYCDSIVIVQHIPLPSDTVRFLFDTCDPDLLAFDTTFLINRFFCDSLVINEYIYRPADTTYLFENTCDSILAGTELTLLSNQYGCDSLLVLSRTFADFTFSEQYTYICDEGVNYTDTLFLQGVSCDSLVFLNFIYVNEDTTRIFETTCDLAESGVFTRVLENQFGCDSVIIITREHLLDQVFISTFTCPPDVGGVFTDTLSNRFGCDSIVTVSVILLQPDTSLISSTTCFLEDEGFFTEVFERIDACDSVVISTVVYQQSDTLNFSSIDCNIKSTQIDTLYLTNQAGCDSILIHQRIPENPEFTINIGPDLLIKEGDRIIINLDSSSEAFDIRWEPVELFPCNNCIDQFISPESGTWVKVYARSENGCEAADSMFIKVIINKDVFIPGAFTPDNNGINDRFTVFGGNRLKLVRSLMVYDRWGNNVFDKIDFVPNVESEGWDGSFMGKAMDPATFVYIAEIEFKDGTYDIFSGEVVLLR